MPFWKPAGNVDHPQGGVDGSFFFDTGSMMWAPSHARARLRVGVSHGRQ